MTRRPSVLMVTGAYYPEVSGAGLQCRALIGACADAASFSVLTTALDPALPCSGRVDGVPVTRVVVSATRRVARWLTAPRFIAAAFGLVRRADIVHLHGFSSKSMIVVALARLLRKKIVIKLTSVGHDDPVSMRARGAALFRSFSAADRFVAVSPRFKPLYEEAGLPSEKLRLIPNGVDLTRFRPANAGEQTALRARLGLPADLPLVLFVGFFSREKCPDLLFDAWTDTFASGPASGLVIVGRSRSDYYEIDASIADRVRADAARLGCADRLFLVEHTSDIEQYYQVADIFALPSLREGLPNAVLEAMATGLPCVVSRLPGVTDTLISDGADGVLVPPGDRGALAEALRGLLSDPDRGARLGAAARRTVSDRFSLAATAAGYLTMYRELTSCAASPAR